MRLAVVIPTLNAARVLPATLASLNGHPHEIVIADGGSADGTVQIANKAGLAVIHAPRGRGRQFQAGVEATTAPWLLLLHADTQLAPGWYEAACDHAASLQDAAAYFRFALLTHDPRARWLEWCVAWRCRLLALPYGDQALLLPRSLLEDVGGIRPLPLMEDVDLVRRIGRYRLQALPISAHTSAVRWEEQGWGRRSVRNLLCLSLWAVGVPASRIARLYG